MNLCVPDPTRMLPSSDKPRLLMVTHRLPYPPDKGERIRAYHMLQMLSHRYDVYLASLVDDVLTLEAWRRLDGLTADMAVRPLGRICPKVRALSGLLRGRSVTEVYFQNARLRHDIGQWIEYFQFDAALAVCSSVADYVAGLPIPLKILDMVDVDSYKWLDYAAHVTGPRSMIYNLEAARLAAYERRLASMFHHVILTTDAEVELYRKLAPHANATAVTNGVDTDYFAPTDFCDAPVAVFVGVLNYKPNVKGLTWLANEIWPRVHQILPCAKLKIVGRDPSYDVLKLGRIKGIEVVGPVDDVRPYVASASLSVAPLQIARGVQNKVLEAMAMGKCVLTTEKVAQGIGADSGRHLVTAQKADQWVQQMVRLLRRPREGMDVAAAARRFVQNHRRWAVCLEPLAEILPGKGNPGSLVGQAA